MKIIGDNGVSLATMQVEDAEFLLALRTDPALNQHLSAVDGTLPQQQNFIAKCLKNQEQKQEYFFAIEYQGQKVGTVRLYDIDYEKNIATWGSWIVKQGNPGLVALSSAYLSYYFCFNNLNIDKIMIDVRKDNKKAFDIYTLYCDFLYEDELNYYLEFKKENFSKFTDKFSSKISNNINIYE